MGFWWSGFWAADFARSPLRSRLDDLPLSLRSHALRVGRIAN